jgi:hypothetical protein
MSAATPLSDPKELAMQERAQALVARGDVVGATRLMDEFLSVHDGDWGSWLYLAGLHARLGRTAPAVAAYQASARQLEGYGHVERARASLQHALRLAPDDEGVLREIHRLEGLTQGLREVPPPPPEPSVPPARPSRGPVAPRPSPLVAGARPSSPGKKPAARRGVPSSKDVTTAVVARRSSAAALRVVPVADADSTAVVARGVQAPGPVPEQPVSAPRPSRAPVKLLRRSGVKPAVAGPGADPQATVSIGAVRTAAEPAADQTFLILPPVPAPPSATDPHLAIFDILDAEKRDEVLRSARPRNFRHDETTPMLPRRALR